MAEEQLKIYVCAHAKLKQIVHALHLLAFDVLSLQNSLIYQCMWAIEELTFIYPSGPKRCLISVGNERPQMRSKC